MIRKLIVLFSLLELGLAQTEVTVQTPVGTVIGTVREVFSLFNVRRFYGIPYAEPPVGNLRFRKPVAKAAFSSSFNATEKGGLVCHQEVLFGVSTQNLQSEDCLTLNVFTPTTATPSSKKPVMVWIHGGGFIQGSKNDYDGESLSGIGDVVIVAMNYRLAVHGFLSTGDASLPGNLGLWDQQLAIQWVHDNIESFGGDRGKVTIFGESAGASSVIFQTFYPGNLGLFHRAIAQSGGMTNPWAYVVGNPAENVNLIANDVGCTRDTTAEIVDCLRTIDNDELIKQRNRPVTLTPVYDNDFVADLPERLLSGKTSRNDALTMFHSVDLMLGINNADGLEIIYEWMPLLGKTDFENFTVTRQEFETAVVPYTIQGFYKLDSISSLAAERAIINEYTNFSDPENENERIKRLTKLSTDVQYGINAVKTADQHGQSQNKTTYCYLFSVKPIIRLLAIPTKFEGPDVMMHADDIFFVFGGLIEYTDIGSDLYNVYLATMTMWSNFAKSGNPNIPVNVKQYLNIDWPEYGDSRNFQEIRINPGPGQQNFMTRELHFWNEIVPRTLGICPEMNQMTEYETVTTPVGDILGKEEFVPMTDNCGYRVTKFLGIPYAEAPIGPLRFKKPVAKADFTETFNATREGATCYQMNTPLLPQIYPRSEDCLLLNVFVPRGSSDSQGHRKAVMIWIHGGGFMYGQSNSYSDFGVLTGYGDVIVVTINYRLSMLGFLTTGDSSLFGNLGLWDQHLAIKWVHDNIQSFGGDPNTITIFGQEAGAASVIYQSFYPGNMGLFHRVIAQSGSSNNVWAYQDLNKAMEYTRSVAQNLSCSLHRTSAFIACLQSKPISQLETFIGNNPSIPLPVRDNDFILDIPENLIRGSSNVQSAINMFKSVDLLMGINNFDGIIDIVLNGISLPISKVDLEYTHVPHFLKMIIGKDAPLNVRLAAIHEYTDWTNPTSERARAHKVADMLTDAFFAVQTIQTADFHTNTSQTKATFMYQFGVKPTQRFVALPSSLEGSDVASSGDELSFVIGRGIRDVQADDMGRQQFQTYTSMMNMWCNFAKSGNPNSPENITHMIQTTWPMYSTSRQYLDIKPDMTSVKDNFRSRAHNFWSTVIPETLKASDQTATCETSSTGAFNPTSHLKILIIQGSFMILLQIYSYL